jgi:hypothetical protein
MDLCCGAARWCGGTNSTGQPPRVAVAKEVLTRYWRRGGGKGFRKANCWLLTSICTWGVCLPWLLALCSSVVDIRREVINEFAEEDH